MDNNIQPKNTNLIEITTPTQAKRGNRQFFDQHHKVSYITYANGYVRREIKATYVSPYTASNDIYMMMLGNYLLSTEENAQSKHIKLLTDMSIHTHQLQLSRSLVPKSEWIS